MPFVLIIQLVMSGMMFTLPENAESIKELTISKWGLSAICSSADVNELPNRETLVKFEEIKMQDPTITDWKESGIVQEKDDEYKATTRHVLTCWSVLSGYSIIYGFIGILFLKLVDKDKR